MQSSSVYLEEIFCEDCMEQYTNVCSVCGATRVNHNLQQVGDELVCIWCIENKENEENG